MKHWPSISTGIAIVFAMLLILTPLGWELLSALASGEGLSSNVASGILTIGVLVLLVLGFVEWLIRWNIHARRNFPSPAQTTISDQHKPE